MSRGVLASPGSHMVISTPRIPSITRQRRCSVVPSASRDNPLFPSNLKPISYGLLKFPRINLRCNSTGDSGENESRTVLDAFFLGKALGEALTERLESTMGEFLSIIGRLQAEQQKQVLEFQEEVLEKARRAKEQASQEAMEAQGLISKSTSLATSTVNGVSETTSSVSDSVISAASSSVSKPTNEDPFFGVLKD
ncbi:hypothetical protein Pfo_017701 [Paulownia fortunei]|nr:hypothetical protein Pfo_017701 [Paulownia fortunei]